MHLEHRCPFLPDRSGLLLIVFQVLLYLQSLRSLPSPSSRMTAPVHDNIHHINLHYYQSDESELPPDVLTVHLCRITVHHASSPASQCSARAYGIQFQYHNHRLHESEWLPDVLPFHSFQTSDHPFSILSPSQMTARVSYNGYLRYSQASMHLT